MPRQRPIFRSHILFGAARVLFFTFIKRKNAILVVLSLYLMDSEEQLILVDANGAFLGLMPKGQVHLEGVLHKAFSVFVFNSSGELLLQQRAATKYHSPLLWTNTCCSHQRRGETNIQAGERRLREEMGIRIPLEEVTSFIYKTTLENGLIEHEFDYILRGVYDGEPAINREEVAAWKWMAPTAAEADVKRHPERYTAWFKIIFEKYNSFLKLGN